ncbi:MAG: ATP-grasp domain-containing protein [bacterium]|nr:ATP-grasp domain-containing protein [bacterium]
MPQAEGKLKVAVTGLNATDNPGPGVPVIRSLRDAFGDQLEIIGLVYDTLEPGIYIPGLANRFYQIPYPSTGLDAILARLLEIQAREKYDVLFSTLDTELYSFRKLAGELHGHGIATYLPETEQLKLRGKDQLSSFCSQLQISTPKTIVINSPSELNSAVNEVGFPCVVKGIFYDAGIVSTIDEAHAVMNKMRYKWGLPLIIQQCLKGDEYNVCALGDGVGNVVGAVAMRKLYITDKGKGWSGVTIFDKTLLELTHKIIGALRWKGGLELEYIRAPGQSEYNLLEINPRFPAWVYLASAAGQNLPAAMVQLARGKKIEYFSDYKVGTLFVRAAWDYISDMSRIESLSMTGEVNG